MKRAGPLLQQCCTHPWPLSSQVTPGVNNCLLSVRDPRGTVGKSPSHTLQAVHLSLFGSDPKLPLLLSIPERYRGVELIRCSCKVNILQLQPFAGVYCKFGVDSGGPLSGTWLLPWSRIIFKCECLDLPHRNPGSASVAGKCVLSFALLSGVSPLGSHSGALCLDSHSDRLTFMSCCHDKIL